MDILFFLFLFLFLFQRPDSIKLQNQQHFQKLASEKRETDAAERKMEEDVINAMSAEEKEVYIAKKQEEAKHDKAKEKHLKVLARGTGSGLHLKYRKNDKTKRKKIGKKGRKKKKSVDS